MLPQDDVTSNSDLDVYARRFEELLNLAAHFNIPPPEAEELVTDILLSSLYSRPIQDMDMWLAGALRCAARRLH